MVRHHPRLERDGITLKWSKPLSQAVARRRKRAGLHAGTVG
jgi:hypothetical protein